MERAFACVSLLLLFIAFWLLRDACTSHTVQVQRECLIAAVVSIVIAVIPLVWG